MPPPFCECGIRSFERLENGDAVQDGEAADAVGEVQCASVGDIAATLMAGHRGVLMPEAGHQTRDIAGHRAIAIGLVLRIRRRLGGLAVPAKVRADDRQAGGGQGGGDCIPRRVRPRMPVQQDDRRARSAVPRSQRHPWGDGDALQGEGVKVHVSLCAG